MRVSLRRRAARRRRTDPTGDDAKETRTKLLNEFGNRVDWFKNDKFLRDLEGDSVDTEILDEELRSLQDDDHSSCRGKTVRFLESNPLQIVLCVLVLVDAGVVVAEILLDLHAIRGQFNETESSLVNCLSFLKTRYADDLTDYHGQNVDHILHLLRARYPQNETGALSDLDTDNNHRKRDLTGLQYPDWSPDDGDPGPSGTGHSVSMHLPLDARDNTDIDDGSARPSHSGILTRDNPVLSHFLFLGSKSNKHSLVPAAVSSTAHTHAQLPSAQGVDSDMYRQTIDHSMHAAGQSSEGADAPPETTSENIGHHRHGSRDHLREFPLDGGHGKSAFDASRQDSSIRPNTQNDYHDDDQSSSRTRRGGGDGDAHIENTAFHGDVTSPNYTSLAVKANSSNSSYADPNYDRLTKFSEKTKLLMKIAHILHYISIAILGVFVIQVFLKIFGMGSDFFRRKMEVFDAVIIIASFQLDIVFLEGVGPGGADEGAALVIIFLLWRLLRVINGIMVTAKQRQEFRIKLQKRARRRAEKRIEVLEEDKQFKEKEIANLYNLCEDKGATEVELNFCKPRRRTMAQKNTSAGLSSIASLSLGFTMSMHMGSGTSNNTIPGAIDSRRTSTTSGDIVPGFMFGVPGKASSRRPSAASSTRSSAENLLFHAPEKKPERSAGPMVKSIERMSMERVLEESPSENAGEDNNNAVRGGSTSKIAPVEGVQVNIGSPAQAQRALMSRPANRLRRHHELNGDAIHLQLEDVVESDDEVPPRDNITSSNSDISDNPNVPLNSAGGRAEELKVPPRPVVVAMEIPNGPVAISSSPLETNSDHITWYSRAKTETESGKLSPTNELSGSVHDQPIRTSASLTSLPSARKTPSPTHTASDKPPSPKRGSTHSQSW